MTIMARSLFCLAALGLSTALSAADAPPALASLTYSGDLATLDALDRDLTAAGRDTAKLAAIESSLLAILRRNDTTFAARQAVCQRLGPILAQSAPKTGADAYKPLGAMLVDERDSDLARLALDPAPGALVDGLFTGALGKTSGRTRLGIIDSIARRRLESTVPALAALLTDQDATTANAAARALGVIGGGAADAALSAAKSLPPAVVGHARLQGTLRRPASDAQRTLRELQDDTRLPASLRTAAFRRTLDLDSAAATARLIEALSGSDWTLKQVALEALACPLPSGTVSALTAQLTAWDAPTQAGVIAALAGTDDASAVPAVLKAAKHTSAEVRTAALVALGLLPGTGDVVTLLARTAAEANSPEAKTARQSLSRLNGPGVTTAILAGAEKGEARIRAAYLEQLALRNLTEGLPLLLKCRPEADAAIRAAAVGSLGDLAPFSQQPAVLDWAIAATDDTEQTRALRALVNITLRNPDTADRGRRIYATLENAQPAVAIRLMPVLARLGGAASADCAAKLASRDDAKIAQAATEALGRWSDATALPALATITEKATVGAVREAARESALRSLDRNRDKWVPATTAVVGRLLASTANAASRKKLLTLLARAGDAAALQLAQDLQTDSALGDEARYAAAAIQAALAGPPKLRASPAASVSNILDGKTSTRWSAPALGEEWVEIDFLLSRPLRRLTLDQTGRTGEFPEKYEVHVTNDPEAPGPVVVQGQGQRNKTVIDLPAGTKGRYVIINNTVERKDTPWAICELYVD